MQRLTVAVLGLAVLTVAPGVANYAHSREDPSTCPTSPLVNDTAPREPNADRVGPGDWYMNADRTIWAGPVPPGGWSLGGTLHSGTCRAPGQKTYWVRPQGTTLVISGRRLDGDAPPLQAHIPCCYPTGFQIVALHFPTIGCWEVLAEAGGSQLRFVTRVSESTVDRTN